LVQGVYGSYYDKEVVLVSLLKFLVLYMH
jgi:hypothetical protein